MSALLQQNRKAGYCPTCGLHYLPELDEDRLWHGRVHSRFLRGTDTTAECTIPRTATEDVIVTPSSPKWMHRLMYARARALGRQERYPTQWGYSCAPGPALNERNGHGILLLEDGRFVGAASFSFVEWRKVFPPGWRLWFVWVSARYRRQGVLSKRWPLWLDRYGHFTVEPPWSDAMKAFLAKVGFPPGQEPKDTSNTSNKHPYGNQN